MKAAGEPGQGSSLVAIWSIWRWEDRSVDDSLSRRMLQENLRGKFGAESIFPGEGNACQALQHRALSGRLIPTNEQLRQGDVIADADSTEPGNLFQPQSRSGGVKPPKGRSSLRWHVSFQSHPDDLDGIYRRDGCGREALTAVFMDHRARRHCHNFHY